MRRWRWHVAYWVQDLASSLRADDRRSTVSYEDIETREPHEEPHGTCDWGYCDQEAAAWRWSAQHGWLPVCADHVDGRDAAQARIEALEAQVGAVRSDLVEAVARL